MREETVMIESIPIIPNDKNRGQRLRRAAVLFAVGLATASCANGEDAASSPDSPEATMTAINPVATALSSRVCDPSLPGPVISASGEPLFCEEMQAPSAGVFEDYFNASGELEQRITIGDTILVTCVARGPAEAAPSTDGIWYKIAEPTQLTSAYVPANTFWNVKDHSIAFKDQPASDALVPECVS